MITFEYINFDAKTVSKDAEMALFYWHRVANCPLKMLLSLSTHPTKGPELLQLCIAAAERTINKTPPLVVGDRFDEHCRKFMLWLRDQKQIVNLTHDGELDPPAQK